MRNGWETRKLGEVTEYEKIPNKRNDLPYVGLEDIESNTGVFLGTLEVQQVKSATFFFNDKHVLYGRLRPYLNKVLLPNFSGHCSTEIFPIKVSPEIDRRFLFYWLISESTVKKIDATWTGARMPRANMNAVADFSFSFPQSLSEQQQIVSILDEAFAAIDQAKQNLQRNLQNAKDLFQSELNRVFESRGEGWEENRLENVVDEKCKLSYGIVQPGDECPGGLPVVRPTDLTHRYISISDLKRINPKLAEAYKKTTLTGDELLLCVRGSTGTVSIATMELKGANVTRGIVPIRFNTEIILQDFGYYLLTSPRLQQQIKAKTYGAALMQINIADLRKLQTPYPSIKTQQKIVHQLDTLSSETKKLEDRYRQKLNNLEELKKSILERAFRGELTSKLQEI